MTTKSSITLSQTSDVLKKLNLNDSEGDVFATLNKLLNSHTFSSDKSINDDMKDVQLFKAIILSHTIFFSEPDKHEDLCQNLTNSAFLDQLAIFLKNKGSVEDKSTIDILNMIYTLLVNCTFLFDWFCDKVYRNKEMMGVLRDNIKLRSGNWEDNASSILYDSVSIIFNMLRQKVKYREGSDMKDIGGMMLEFIRRRREKHNYFQMMCFICFCLIESPSKSQNDVGGRQYLELLRETRDKCEKHSDEIYRNFTLRELKGVITHLNETVSWMTDILSAANSAEVKNFSEENKEVDVTYQWDMFLSYSHANKNVVNGIYDCLIDKGYKVWIDFVNMKNSVKETVQEMPEGINNSKLFISALSSDYEKSKPCLQEFTYAEKRGKKIIFVKVEENYKIKNVSIDFVSGLHLYVKYQTDNKHEFYEDIISKVKSALEEVCGKK